MQKLWLALVFSLVSGLALADSPLIEVSPDVKAPDITKVPDGAVQAYPWADLGAKNYGHNYQVYVPMNLKSDNPDVERTYEASGYPRNGVKQTPEGRSCATDADCQAPLGCFPRADSGLLPVKLCAYPPPY